MQNVKKYINIRNKKGHKENTKYRKHETAATKGITLNLKASHEKASRKKASHKKASSEKASRLKASHEKASPRKAQLQKLYEIRS